MNKEKDYTKDLAEIRNMMERTSKFLSLSGWAGIMAGIYASIGAYVAHTLFQFRPLGVLEAANGTPEGNIYNVIALAALVLVLSVGTAIYLSYRRARKTSESVWNATSRRLLYNMGVPLLSGGLLLLMFVEYGLIGLLAPITLIFYGLALFNAGNFTYHEVKYLGFIQIVLGLLASYFIAYSLLIWAFGFGFMHIVYGIYIYVKHER